MSNRGLLLKELREHNIPMDICIICSEMVKDLQGDIKDEKCGQIVSVLRDSKDAEGFRLKLLKMRGDSQ